MADLTGVNDTLPVRLGGVSLSSGLPDHYADVNASAQLLVADANIGPVTPGTAAANSGLMGGQYNTTLPTLTTGQQAALQLDSSGRLIAAIGTPPVSLQGTGTVTALSGNVIATTAGYAALFINITGTWVGTLQFQAQNGDGTWFAINVSMAATGLYANSSTAVNTTGQINCAGYTQVRVIATAWTSGTATVSWNSAPYDHLLQVYQVGSPANFLTNSYTLDGAGAAIGSTSNTGSSLYVIKPDASVTGTLGALNAILNIPINDVSSAYALISGTWVGTIQFQGSVNGTTFVPLEAVQGGSTNAYSTAGFSSNGGVRVALPGGFTSIQAVMTAYTSGTATVVINTSAAPANIETVQFNAANLNTLSSGAVTTNAPTYSTGTNQPISLNTGGALRVTDAAAEASLAQIVTNTSASATDFISTGTITAVNGNVSVYAQGVYTVTASITGTWVATLVIEGQAADNNWYPLEIYQPSSNTTAFVTSISANGLYAVVGGGFLNIRVRASAYTSGTVSVALDGSLAQQSILAGQLGQWQISGSAANTSGSIAGNGNILQLPSGAIPSLTPYAGVTLEISGTWSSTLTLVGSNGGSYYTIDVVNLSNPNAGPQSTITANGLYYAPLGCANLELVSSGYVSGTVLCYASFRAVPPVIAPPYGTPASPQVVRGPAASGSAVSGNPVLIGASDGTNAQTLQVNPVNNGVESLLTQNNENLRQTYSIGVGGSSFPAIAGAPTDVFILNGSATKTIRIINITFSMTATTAVLVPVQFIKRSSANAGGTSGSAAVTPHDSNNAAATATNLFYTANATTLGTQVGTLVRAFSYLATTATTTPQTVMSFDFGQNGGQPIVLRGTAQGLAINLNGVTIAGGKLDMTVAWTEDNT